ncbi:unnamed protein product, partial [Hapterophycus canaliculatus]
GGGIGGGARAFCHVCGTALEGGTGYSTQRVAERESSGRGALFLVPSADVERKAARAAATAADSSPAVAMAEENAHDCAACGDDDNRAAEAQVMFPARSSTRTRSPPSLPARIAGGGEARGAGLVPTSIVTSIGLGDGVRSLEAHLARLEAGFASCGPGGIAETNDEGGPAGSDRFQAAAAPRERGGEGGERLSGAHREGGPQYLSIDIAWADALRELRAQVTGLRHRAEVTEEMLEGERAGKDGLDEEVLRLRMELLKQQRSYWQATATLKDRYERALREAEQGNKGEEEPVPSGFAAVGSVEALASPAADKEFLGTHKKDKAAAKVGEVVDSSSVSRTNNEQVQQQQCGPSSGGSVDERLRTTSQELQEVRSLHDREAKDAAAELTRVIEAHRARVAALEEKLRRTRRKMGAMARPKPSTRRRESAARGHGRGRGVGGDDGAGDFGGVLLTSTPLSADELLNLLSAADEEAFEARGKAQRLEYELHAKSAEVDALLLLREPGTVKCTTTDHPAQTGVEAVDGGGSATATGTGLASVARYARIAFAETEVENLRDRSEASRELVVEAQREASALRLAGYRKTAGRADADRSREKELRRQVSAYKREAERLRSAAVATAAGLTSATGKNVGVGRRGGGGGAAGAAAGEAEAEAAMLKGRAKQLVAAREESERRGRTIVSLRAAKTALGQEVQRLRQAATDQGEKVSRVLKDVGVKGNMVNALREKVAVLEGEILVHSIAKANDPAAAHAVSVVATADKTRGADAPPTAATADGGAAVTTTAGSGDAAGIEPQVPTCDVNTAMIRQVRAECDRLRANMRGWRGSLSKKAEEIRAQKTEIERLEGEAEALRGAAARKEDAYRITKKEASLVCGLM